MLALQMAPVVLALLVLAAHFYRHGQLAFVALALALIGLLAVPRRWASRVVQTGLLLGAAEWARTLLVLARVRLEHGMPATRMILILAAVALLTGASALLLRTRRARARFRRTR
jgi:hypothetical protein